MKTGAKREVRSGLEPLGAYAYSDDLTANGVACVVYRAIGKRALEPKQRPGGRTTYCRTSLFLCQFQYQLQLHGQPGARCSITPDMS